jgi:hypothetical protein
MEVDEVFLKSPFMRLFETYKSIKHIKSESWSFWNWLHLLIATDFNDFRFLSGLNHTVDIALLSDYDMRNCIREGIVITSDIEVVIELYKFVPTVYNNATIKGVQLRGRGREYCEYKSPLVVTKWGAVTSLILPSNIHNNLLDNWDNSTQYSSFVKYNNWKINKITNKNAPSEQYAQANYFFRCSIPLDPYLHNVGFANITGRLHETKTVGACSVPYITVVNITKVEDIPKPAIPKPCVESSEILGTNVIDIQRRSQAMELKSVDEEKEIPVEDQTEIPPHVIVNNFRSEVQFICASFIESTSIAVCGMNSNDDPILLPGNRKGLSQEEQDDGIRFCCANPRNIDRLYLIELHRTRRHVNINKSDSTIPEVDASL